jgi:hypothetical protein
LVRVWNALGTLGNHHDGHVSVGVVGDGDGGALAGQFRQHGDHSCEELGRLPMALLRKSPQQANDIEHRSAFHGGASCDRDMPCTIGFRSTARALGDISS